MTDQPIDVEALQAESLRRVQVIQAYHFAVLDARERGEEPPPRPPEVPEEALSPDRPAGYYLFDRAWAPDPDQR